ncbi:MAG: pseudouridine synthase [Aquamicrobium sp.]|uniref:pseudouridine synthase n=1 Tax=Aquamicrobium sp. TaxID=1872579 RepID=UPI00349E73DD|nr:pseudouridine synthase [Aquamicrobium sp.]
MNDDRKKPARGGGNGRGGAGDGGKPRFAKPGGDKPRTGKPGAGKWKPREQTEAAGEERRPRKPYAPRDGDGPKFDKPRGDKPRFDGPRRPREDGGEAKKTFQRQDGMKRASAKTADGRPMKPRPGKWERREAAAEAGDGERRARKPYAPRDGDKPAYDKPRFAKPGDKPRFDGPRKPRDGEAKPFRRQDGEKRAFVKRDDKDAAPRLGRREREDAQGAEQEEGGGERIARRLARAGVASRRDAEEMIAAGRITLNGKVLDTPAVNVGARDRIEIDGKPIPDIERTRLFLFHKPAGVVTTSRDPEGRRTVFDVLPKGLPRLMTVGRLDINTQGLLLLTNDGGLSRVLELPATGWLRRYRVRVHGKVEPEALEGLKEGIAVDGVFYGAVEATLDREQGSNAWLTVGLREGKNREVKNILGALGLDVTRLIRVSYGPFQLGDLPEGELRELKGKYLRDQLGERLIEESGANFDAPILNAFSSKDEAASSARKDKPRPHRGEDAREARREDALGRLDTRKPAFGKPGGKPGGKRDDRDGRPAPKGRFGKPDFREERKEERPRSRTANVWMAPGAKPMGEKKKAALAERSEGRRYAGKPRPEGRPGAKAGDKPRFGSKPGGGKPGGSKPGGRPGGRGGPRKPRGED